ncbi:MAG: SIMPL domain-containing protein [Chloroflexi bacterium]|nr:SIMPL domain-containing protein [Chloroflexota bacterium]
MKTQILLLVALAGVIFAFVNWSPLRAETAAPVPPRPITTTGDAEIKVAPDEVLLILGVETWDKSLAVAKQHNDARVQQVFAVTRNFGIEPRHVQTEHINVEPRYRNGTYTDADFIGFFVRKTIVITLKDVARFDDFYTALLEAGTNHVYGIHFRTTELRKYRDQARALAIKAAQEKANALAGELGLKIGKPQSISENASGWWAWYSNWWGGGNMSQNVVQNVSGGSAPSEEGTFAPGQISVTARVSVTFDME